QVAFAALLVVVAAGIRCPAAPRAGADSLRCSLRAATRPRCTARLILRRPPPGARHRLPVRDRSRVRTRGQLHHDQRPGPGAADRVLWVTAEALFSWRDPDQLVLGGPQIVRQVPGELCWSSASGPTSCPPVSAELGAGHTESATLSWTSGGP